MLVALDSRKSISYILSVLADVPFLAFSILARDHLVIGQHPRLCAGRARIADADRS